MAGLKKLSTRIINKHATAAVWNTKTNFIPLQAEIIVYDPGYDSTDGITYDYSRHKIGDGTHNVTELPFSDAIEVGERVTDVENDLDKYVLNIDYNSLLAFDTDEIVFDPSNSAILGEAILGQLVLG